MIRCIFCRAEVGRKTAGWTSRRLAEPLATPAPYGHVTAAGWYAVCPTCSRWMNDRSSAAPVGLLRSVREGASKVRPEWAAECRELLLGHALRIADALGPPKPISGPRSITREGESS